MQWRHFLTSRSKREHTTTDVASTVSTPLGYALEARMMFDGAVAATVTQADAANSASEAPQASDSKEAAQGNNDNQTHNGQSDHDVSSDNATSDLAVAGETARKEVVFIDTSLTDYQTLVDNVPAGVEVVLLDGSRDGLSQLAEWAKTHRGYDAIHVLSHGGEGELQLGTLILDSSAATDRAADLATLGSALTESGDILLYGCEVAQNTGQNFVSLLAQITGADIAASDDTTGLGGDWNLEMQTGSIEAAALHIDSYQHALNVSNTDVSLWIDGVDYGGNPVGPGSEIFMDLAPDEDHSNWYIDIDPVTSTITMTIRNDISVIPGLTSFELVFNNTTNGTLDAITSITLDSGATTSAADLSASVFGNDKTITFHVNTDSTSGNGVLVWHFTSTSTGGSSDTLPSATGSGINPTYTENGTDVALFGGVSVDTQDSGQTFTGGALTVSNVAGNTEYLNIHGIKVALSNGNSVSLGSGYGTASVSLSGGTATVSISGATLSNADMGALLSGITYGNSSDNPGNATRIVTLTQLTDSGANNNSVSLSISSSVTVVPVNDAPTDITLSTTTFTQSLGSNGTVATLTATDVDSSVFTYALVSGSGSTDNALFTVSGNELRVVNAAGMAAGTYSVRLQVSDGEATYDKVVTLVVQDDIPPTFDQSPAVSAATPGGFNLSGSVTEAGNVYYVVVADGASAPTVAQVIAGQNAAGATATASGSQVLGSSPYDFSFTLTGLAASTMYDVYVVAKDSTGNNTVSVVKVDASTASAGHAPTLSATGSNPVLIGGMAGSVDLFSGVSASTNDSGQTFSSLTLTVSNAVNSGEFINVGGTNINLGASSAGTLSGIGSYIVTRAGNSVTLQIGGMNASSDQMAGLVDGLRYGITGNSVTAGARDITLSAVSDSGTSNNTTALSVTSSVNVQASNGALYVTAGNDTGDNAAFGSSLQDDINDGGGLSLREALYWANQTSGIDRIVFQTDVSLSSSILSPTESLLIDGQSFTLNGGGYSSFQIETSSITFAIQNLTLTNFTTADNSSNGGVLGINPLATNVNLRLYNVEITGNTDDGWGNGIIDLYNLQEGGKFNIDFDRVSIHNNILFGNLDADGVIKVFVSGTLQTLALSITNSAIYDNRLPAGTTSAYGVAALQLIGNSANPTTTNVSLTNVTFTGQNTGILFEFYGNANTWTVAVRNSIIAGNTRDTAVYNHNSANGSYTIIGSNNVIGSGIDVRSATDVRLAQSASNAINQGNAFYTTGTTDVRGLDRTRQGTVDIGAYESQFTAGTAPQVDLNGSNTGTDYSASISDGFSTGIAITDSLATLIQSDGDSRLWTLTLNLAGATDGSSESLHLSDAARLAAHAAGITVNGNDSQTLTLTGGASLEAFQTALRAIVYVNLAASPTAGSRTITVNASDDASTSATSTLNLVTGNPPVVATPVPAQSVAQDGSFNFTVPAGTFTDPDGDPLTLSATLADGSALPAWLSFNPTTGTFSGTPGNADVGSLSIKITATDTTNASVSTSFSLTVTNVNDVPVVATPIPAQSVAQDGSFTFTVPAGTFTDPDGDTLTLSATLADGSALPGWLHFDATTGNFSGTPGNADVGSLSIRVTASDGDASVSTSFSLTITNVNDAPVVATPVPAQSVAQDGNFNFSIPAGTFIDPDGDPLTLSATLADGSALPAWLSFNPATGTFSGTPGNTDVGSLSIKITANDGHASVSTTFSLTVTNINDVPVVATPIPAQSVAQDGSFTFTVPAGTFTDPDGDTLTLSATLANGSALPGWLHFDATTGNFSGTPGNADVGSLSIRVTASDGDASVSTSFSLTITNVNDAPVVATPVPAKSVAQDGSFNFSVPAGTFIDPDGDPLTLSATLADGSALPVWLSFNPATGTFSGTPGNADIGSLSIKITANDGHASVSTTFSLTVTEVNDAPVVAAPIPAQSVAQDGRFNFTVPAGTFTDQDGDTLTLSATLANGSALPGWLHFDATTGNFSGTPGNADVGSLSIRVTASDGDASVSTSFSLTITNVNDAPLVSTPIPAKSVPQDGNFNFTVPASTFTDPDGDPLKLSATLADGSALPAWLSFNPTTGTFTGKPGSGDIGSLTIKVTGTDSSNASVSTNFTLTVSRAAVPPTTVTPTEVIGGDPQFRLSDGNSPNRPGEIGGRFSQAEFGTTQTPNSLGNFSARGPAAEGSMLSGIFSAPQQYNANSAAPGSLLATTFARSMAQASGTRFESQLGSFPSFNKDPAQGGTSSLASVFSGIYLPSLTPMEVFTSGSWKDVNFNTGKASLQDAEDSATQASTAFTPSLHRQLQQIGDAEGQRLAAIEQALYDRARQQG